MAERSRVEILLGFKDRFSPGLKRTRRTVSGFANHVNASMRGAGRGVTFLSERINGLGTIAGLIGGGAVGRSMLDFDSRLRTIANTAQITDGEMEALKGQILAISGLDTGQLGGELLGGVSELVEAGMDLPTIMSMLEMLGQTATATDSDLNDLARTAYFFNTTAGVLPEDMEKTISGVAMIANAGSFSLKMMGEYLPEAVAGMKALGMEGDQAAIQAAAALQMGYQARGGAAKGATSTIAFMSSLVQNADKLKKKLGVDIFDGVDEAGVKKFRDFADIVRDISTASGGDVTKLQPVFNEKEARDWIQMVSGDLDQFNGYLEKGAEAGTLLSDNFERNMDGPRQQLRATRAELEKFLLMGTGGQLKGFTKLLRVLNEHPAAIRAIVASMTALAGVTASRKAITFGTELFRAMRGTAAGAGGKGGVGGLGGVGGAKGDPVYVTNWPGALGGGAVPGAAGAPGVGGGGRGRPARPGLRQAGLQTSLMAGYAGWEVGTGAGDALLNNVLAPTGGGAVIQKQMARWMSLFTGADSGHSRVAGFDGESGLKGWAKRAGSTAWNQLTLVPDLLAPKKLGGISQEEIEDSKGALNAARINMSLSMVVRDDRLDVEVDGVDGASLDDLAVQHSRS